MRARRRLAHRRDCGAKALLRFASSMPASRRVWSASGRCVKLVQRGPALPTRCACVICHEHSHPPESSVSAWWSRPAQAPLTVQRADEGDAVAVLQHVGALALELPVRVVDEHQHACAAATRSGSVGVSTASGVFFALLTRRRPRRASRAARRARCAPRTAAGSACLRAAAWPLWLLLRRRHRRARVQ